MAASSHTSRIAINPNRCARRSADSQVGQDRSDERRSPSQGVTRFFKRRKPWAVDELLEALARRMKLIGPVRRWIERAGRLDDVYALCRGAKFCEGPLQLVDQ